MEAFRMTYEELVKQVNDPSQYGKSYHEDFETVSENPLHEINAWTYWQGIGVRNPKILVLGQDWGNSQVAKKYFSAIEKNLASGISEDEKIFSYKRIHGILANNKDFDTDKNLAEGFANIKENGTSKYPDVLHVRYSDLFFTNLLPGYRKDQKNTGGFKASWITEQVRCDFKNLLKVLRPQIVICLGKNTFIQAARIYDHKNPLKGRKWNQYLDSDFTPIEIIVDSISESTTYLYPMPHPGYFGKLNRGESVYNNDWERLGAWMEKKSI